ncbi:8546_t:CDS:2 [Entrophospora sp. SA101]|nr:8546_t:CDS:2 [Entrophospora sp. SA101]
MKQNQGNCGNRRSHKSCGGHGIHGSRESHEVIAVGRGRCKTGLSLSNFSTQFFDKADFFAFLMRSNAHLPTFFGNRDTISFANILIHQI